MSDETTRTIEVNYLARVEGEGALTIKLAGGRATVAEFRIFEPPRFFEAFLRGRRLEEAPDITARICGICPVAYIMSACHAMEDALGVAITPEVRALRRLLYCGEWIESHVLHMFMLHLPDFLGYQDSIALAKDHPEKVKLGLRMKKAGNRIVQLLGGREIHPVNVRVGGFYKAPPREPMMAMLPELDACLEGMAASLRWMATLEFPELERDYEFVSLRHPDEYPFNEGRLVSNRGLDIAISEYPEHFEELHVERSNALQSRIKGRGAYLCGPLARFNLNYDRLPEGARELAEELGLAPPVRNPYRSLLVRGLETWFALHEARRILEGYRVLEKPYADLPRVAGVGRGCTEAPRGLLFHEYRVDAEGLIEFARIVPPTSQNQLAIEEDLAAIAAELTRLPLEEATWRAEQTVRNYDPCISCATHFLRLKVEREA